MALIVVDRDGFWLGCDGVLQFADSLGRLRTKRAAPRLQFCAGICYGADCLTGAPALNHPDNRQRPGQTATTPTIREIDPASDAEIDLVAARMRQTLIEVEGEETGTALYTLEWLQDRVRFHLDPAKCIGKVFLAEAPGGQIIGHTIVRIETDDAGRQYGLFSTTYVAPESRRLGVAAALLMHGEGWMQQQQLPESATWTSATNAGLIALYTRRGYAITQTHIHETTATEMVRLSRKLADPD